MQTQVIVPSEYEITPEGLAHIIYEKIVNGYKLDLSLSSPERLVFEILSFDQDQLLGMGETEDPMENIHFAQEAAQGLLGIASQ